MTATRLYREQAVVAVSGPSTTRLYREQAVVAVSAPSTTRLYREQAVVAVVLQQNVTVNITAIASGEAFGTAFAFNVETYNNAVMADSPWGYWKLESGGTDSSGNGHDATASGISYVAGKIGNAASIPGGAAELNVGAGSLFGTVNFMTVEFWFKSSVASDRAGLVTSDNEGTLNQRNWSMRIKSTGQVEACYFFSSSVSTAIVTPANLCDGNWHHIVWTYRNASVTPGEGMRLYVDGAQVAFLGSSGVVQGSASSNIKIGTAAAFGSMTGLMDEVALYKDVDLSASRIMAHYQAGSRSAQTVTATGIASGGAFGTAVVVLSLQIVAVTGIASGEVVGTAIVTVVGSQTVAATGIASGVAFGTATVFGTGPVNVGALTVRTASVSGALAILGPTVSAYTTQTPAETVTLSAGSIGNDFVFAVAGQLVGLRFYRAATATSTSRTMRVWQNSTTQLGNCATSGDSGSGWKSAFFGTPIPITAGQTVRVCIEDNATPESRMPTPGADIVNGVVRMIRTPYSGASNAYPTGAASNVYFVDVLFQGWTTPLDVGALITCQAGVTGQAVAETVLTSGWDLGWGD